MATTIQHLKALNDQAITFLEHEETSNAIALLRRGIVMTVDDGIISLLDGGAGSHGGSRSRIQPSNPIAGLCDETLYVYSRAITFGDDYVLNDSDLRGSLLFAAVFLLNMAMANHQKAKRSGRTIHYQEAADMYSTMLDLVLTCEQQDERLLCLVLIALNNRGQILHEHFCDFEVSQTLFQTLSGILFSHNLVDMISDEDYHGLLQNALCLRFPRAAASA
jgi:hypothetical protein